MKIKDTELIVVQSDISTVSADIMPAAPERGTKIDEEALRRAIGNTLIEAQEHHAESLAFDTAAWTEQEASEYLFTPDIISKLMAQEVFRFLRLNEDGVLKKILFVVEDEKTAAIFKKNLYDYLRHLTEDFSGGPYLTVDGIVEYQNGIVLIERKNPPLGWALPGGFLDCGEDVARAVVREVKEETNLDFTDICQFKVCSDPRRDPRFHTVSVVFYGKGQGTLRADSDARNAQAFRWDRLPAQIAFDHRQIIEEYREKIKNQR